MRLELARRGEPWEGMLRRAAEAFAVVQWRSDLPEHEARVAALEDMGREERQMLRELVQALAG